MLKLKHEGRENEKKGAENRRVAESQHRSSAASKQRTPGEIMSNDVERIKGLEKESGIALPGRSFDEIDNFAANGYAADQNGNVTGLNLSNNNLEKTPASESLISTLPHLHHLKKLSLSNTTLTDYSFLKRFWGQVHGL